MRRGSILAGILALASVNLIQAIPVLTDSLSIGVRTDSVGLVINIGGPPRAVTIPEMPVYHVPSMPYNYFVYQNTTSCFTRGCGYQPPPSPGHGQSPPLSGCLSLFWLFP